MFKIISAVHDYLNYNLLIEQFYFIIYSLILFKIYLLNWF